MSSPAYYSLHPLSLFLADCGIGSDPNSSGPCTGTYGPAQASSAAASVFSTGKGQVFAVGALLLVLAAVLVLIRLFAGATSGRARKGKGTEPLACERCGAAISTGDEFPTSHGDLCGDCFFASGEGALTLSAGQAMCMTCGEVFAVADGDAGQGCPSCGVSDDLEEGVGICSLCGVASDELVGDLFPACPECAAESEERALREDTDEGPSDSDAYDGNPDGIGGGGVRA